MIEYKIITLTGDGSEKKDAANSALLNRLIVNGWTVQSFQASPGYGQRSLIDGGDVSFDQTVTFLLVRDAPATVEAPLKLFVWQEFRPDFSPGLAVVVAASYAKAIEMLKGKAGDFGEFGEYQELEIAPMVFHKDGGG